MKIVDVAEFYAERGGGVRTYINQKLQAGSAAGHEIVIVAPGPEDAEEERLGGRILWVKGPPMPFDPRYYLLWNEAAVHRLLDREAPDLVEGSSPWTGGWFAARWSGTAPRAFVFHQDPVAVYPETLLERWLGAASVNRLFAWYWAYLRQLSRRCDATVVAGEWLAAKLSRFGIANAVAVPFGIDKAAFGPERRSDERRRELASLCGIRSEPARLLVTISRFHPEKRLSTLFDAFRRARADDPRLGWVLIGDGPQRQWVEAQAQVTPGLHLAGFLRDRQVIARTLASCDAMLHGSSAETYGLVVAEALCSGLPLVVPDRGGASDLAASDYSERYPPGDALAAAAAIRRLLRRPPASLRQTAAAAGRQRVVTMEQHFDQLFQVYEGLATSRRAKRRDPNSTAPSP